MWEVCRYVGGMSVCGRCVGMWEVCRYMGGVQVCERCVVCGRCVGIWETCRYVGGASVCGRCVGMLQVYRYVAGVSVCGYKRYRRCVGMWVEAIPIWAYACMCPCMFVCGTLEVTGITQHRHTANTYSCTCLHRAPRPRPRTRPPTQRTASPNYLQLPRGGEMEDEIQEAMRMEV